MIAYKRHTFLALVFFFFAALMGLLLRGVQAFGNDIGINYRFFVHAHSHVALMGWIHFALMTMITHYFLEHTVPVKKYLRVFWLTVSAVIGMLISFPIQGYAVFSIIFSSLFLISSYFYAAIVFKRVPANDKKKASYKTLKWALIFMILSTFGPWAVGGVMATVGPSSHWYRTVIYFYLHFQYNAWIILGVIAIILKLIENSKGTIHEQSFKMFLITFVLGSFLTVIISVLYVEPPFIYYILAVIGSISQIISLWYLFNIIRDNKAWFKTQFNRMHLRLLTWAGILLAVKSFLQFLGSTPQMAKMISENNYLAIGFLHLLFLGVITMSLFALLDKMKLIRLNNFSIQTYAMGFAFSEFIIFYKPGTRILGLPNSPNYNVFLFIASLLLVVGIIAIIIRMIRVRFELK